QLLDDGTPYRGPKKASRTRRRVVRGLFAGSLWLGQGAIAGLLGGFAGFGVGWGVVGGKWLLHQASVFFEVVPPQLSATAITTLGALVVALIGFLGIRQGEARRGIREAKSKTQRHLYPNVLSFAVTFQRGKIQGDEARDRFDAIQQEAALVASGRTLRELADLGDFLKDVAFEPPALKTADGEALVEILGNLRRQMRSDLGYADTFTDSSEWWPRLDPTVAPSRPEPKPTGFFRRLKH